LIIPQSGPGWIAGVQTKCKAALPPNEHPLAALPIRVLDDLAVVSIPNFAGLTRAIWGIC